MKNVFKLFLLFSITASLAQAPKLPLNSTGSITDPVTGTTVKSRTPIVGQTLGVLNTLNSKASDTEKAIGIYNAIGADGRAAIGGALGLNNGAAGSSTGSAANTDTGNGTSDNTPVPDGVSTTNDKATGIYGKTTGTDSGKFGALIGAGTSYRPSFAAPQPVSSSWGGAPAQSCAGVDFQTFLNTVDPAEILNNLKSSYQSGKPAPIANYLLTLNTTNPMLAATLDMVDRQYTARYQAYAQLCQVQEAARVSSDANTRRMAEASDQCFAARVARSISPTAALRECKTAAAVNQESIPGKKDLKKFLMDHTNVTVTSEIDRLLPLLSDERITATGVQVRAPSMSLTQIKGNIEDRTHNALSAILNGTDPNTIARCQGKDYATEPANAQESCIPDAASALVRGNSFLAARQLSASEQEMYLSAISEQVAAVTMQSTIIALRQSLMNMAPKSGQSIPAGELATRRAHVQSEIQRLESDAAQLVVIADQRAQIARTQLLTMQRAKTQIDTQRTGTKEALPKTKMTPVSGLASVFGF